MDIMSLVFMVLYAVNLITILIIIFAKKDSAAVSIAWLLSITFIPVVGLVFYFFLGSTSKIQVLSRKFRLPEIESVYLKQLEKHLTPGVNLGNQAFDDIISLNTNSASATFTSDNEVVLLNNGQETFPRLIEDLSNARETINILYFIFKTRDRIGRQVLDILTKKASEGVEVRLVYDGLATPFRTRRRDFKDLERAGGRVYRHLPSFFKSILQVNYRMHRKMVIIDGQIAYTGGINIGDDYLGEYKKITPWRDTSIRMTGSCVLSLQMRFLSDWVFLEKQRRNKNKTREEVICEEDIMCEDDLKRFFPKPFYKGSKGVQIVSSGPDSIRGYIRDCYIKIINDAREYVYIQSPYFAPDETLLDAIILSAKSGVDVRLMLPGIPDKKFIYYATLSYVDELLSAGVRVYIHKGFLHSKTFVMDGFVSSVGTTNLDIRSFKLDYEVNAFVFDAVFAKECLEAFKNDIKDCCELDIIAYRKRTAKNKFFEAICRLLTPLA